MNEQILRNYAQLCVKAGVNIQEGQTLVVNASIEANDLTRFVVEEAYKAKAGKVIVNYTDDLVSRMHYEYQSVEDLCDIRDWMQQQKIEPLREGAATLHIISETPGVLNGIDAKKISEAMKVRQSKFKEASEITMANKVQWSIAAYPNVRWAKQVFPELSDEAAMEALWKAILDSVKVDEESDSIALWQQHNQTFAEKKEKLNAYNFTSLHFSNAKGTDLHVGLVERHIWAGGDEETINGIRFNPNMPTEEIFTMPHKFNVHGRVVTTKPLDYNGTLIEEFTLDFKDGAVVDYSASNDYDTLKSLIEFDEGSKYIGEVALVPYNSPISMSNILFYNTLFDENASCHLALGRAYPMNVEGGTSMSQEQLDKVGSNNSMTHVDFMFGSEDMRIVGTTQSKEEVVVFEQGRYVI